MIVTFIIPGTPVPKGRPKFYNGIAVTPKKTREYEALVKDVYMSTCGQYLGNSALVCYINLFFQIPKSYSKSKIISIATGHLHHTKKPDVDNCVKAILDGLNGLAYKDDSQIIEIRARKHYADGGEPRAEVTIEEAF